MNIKNYTSSVPAHITIARIEQLLARCGASGVSKEFGPTGQVSALSFHINLNENRLAFRLPADPEAVKKSMLKEIKRPRVGTIDRVSEQAHRTAWKLMQDWTEVQVALIELQKVDVRQVFLAYIWDERKRLTFFDQLKEGKFKALPEHV